MIPPQVSPSGRGTERDAQERSDVTTTTQGEERGGPFLQIESLEVAVAVAVQYEETTRNQLDLLDVAELCKRGTVVEHEGLFQLSYSEWCLQHPCGLIFCRYEHACTSDT